MIKYIIVSISRPKKEQQNELVVKELDGGRALTRLEFHQFSDVPPAVEWFANIRNRHTRRAYARDVGDFSQFVGIKSPNEFRIVTRAHVIAWRDKIVIGQVCFYGVIIGYIRRNGRYLSFQAAILTRMPQSELRAVLIKEQHHMESLRKVATHCRLLLPQDNVLMGNAGESVLYTIRANKGMQATAYGGACPALGVRRHFLHSRSQRNTHQHGLLC